MSINPSSYRIDEEESVDDGTAEHRENEDLHRLNTVTVADYHQNLNRNGGDLNQQQRLINLPQHGSSGNSNATTTPVQQRPDAVAITVPRSQDSLKYVELARPDDDNMMMVRNQNAATKKAEKQSFFQKLYNPNKTKSPNTTMGNNKTISRYDGDEDDEFTPINKEQNNIKITPTKCLPNKTKHNPNDDEELRPLSNGYVVQNS